MKQPNDNKTEDLFDILILDRDRLYTWRYRYEGTDGLAVKDVLYYDSQKYKDFLEIHGE
jgi:hypothetical protein